MLAPTWAIQENEKTNGHKKHGNVTIKHDTNYKDSFWCRYLSPIPCYFPVPAETLQEQIKLARVDDWFCDSLEINVT